MAMATRRSVFFDRSTFSWSSVLAGVVAALVVHVLLVMLGLGIGLLSVDTSTVASSPVGISWGAFLYWAISGIIAAFVGGWIAGTVSPIGTGGAHGLAAWAVATLIVVGAATLGVGSTASIANNLVGPIASVARLTDLTRDEARRGTGTVGQSQTTNQGEVEAARRAVAGGMLGSFIALLIGAAAAYFGGMVGIQTATEDISESDTRVMR
jgi:hypothetical protein